MAGISSKALSFGSPENKHKYNEIELNNTFDINSYDAYYRNYDPQIGRFWQVDPRPTDSTSLYAFVYNNPTRYSDPLGDTVGISFLNPGYENPTLRAEEKDVVKKQKNDGVFVVLSHGHSGGIEYVNETGEHMATTPEEFDALMSAKSPEWKEAIKNGTEITVVLLGCNTASEEYITQDGRKIQRPQTFAEKLSNSFPNLTVVAADGYTIHANKDGKPQVVGVSNHTNNGGFLTFKNGQLISKKYMQLKYSSNLKNKQ